MKNLHKKKIKKLVWGLIFTILIGIAPQETLFGSDTTSTASSQSQTVSESVYRLKDNAAKVTDIYLKGKQAGWTFTIYGVKTQEIKAIHLKRINSEVEKTITISPSDIKEIVKDKELQVTIKGENAEKFSQESFTGSYEIEIEYTDGKKIALKESEYKPRTITVTGHNFKKDIKQVTLKNIKMGLWEILLPKEKVQYINGTTLNLNLDAEAVEKLSGGINSTDIEMTIDYEANCIFNEDLKSWTTTLFGNNFNQGVEKVILRPIAGQALSLPVEEQDIIIPKKDISIENNTRLNVTFGKDTLTKLKEFNHSGEYNIMVTYSSGSGLKDFIADVDVKVLYNYGVQLKESIIITEGLKFDNKDYIEDSLKFTLLSKSTPKVLDVFPKSLGNYPWVNENDLSHNILKDRNFLKITFEDIDGKLEFNSPLGIDYLLSSTVQAVGSNTEYLDREFLNMCRENTDYINQYLFKKDRANYKAYLFIPVKPLAPQANYTVNIADKVLRNDASEDGVIDEGKRYSPSISWEFTTMAVPSVTDEGINIQTVVEGYDSDTIIKIFGDNFYSSSIRVFFNDREADHVAVKQDKKGNTYLEVRLPRSRKLKPGLYNIIIQNDDDHTVTTYGTLSVLSKGEHIPTEEYKVKNEDVAGDVLSDIHVSSDTLYLRSSYRDRARVELNLDELMGEEVWTRRINYRGNEGDSIGELITKSKYGDISIYDLTLDRYGDGREINLSIGRLEPVAMEGAKSKLKDRTVRSDFIEVKAENCTWDEIYLSIPYKNSSGDALAIYRYDTIRRTWTRENSYVDKVNQRVNATTNKAGIFVIIEQ